MAHDWDDEADDFDEEDDFDEDGDFDEDDFEDDEQDELDDGDDDGFGLNSTNRVCNCGRKGGCDYEIDECYEDGVDEDALPCSNIGDDD